MSYATGEANILTRIQTLDDWDTDNSISLSNDSTGRGAAMVNTGEAAFYCMLRPGSFERGHSNADSTLTITRWQTIIHITVLVRPTESPEYRLVALRQSIIDELDQHYRAGGSVIDYGEVVSGAEVNGRTVAQPVPFLEQEIVFLWEEESDFTQSDS